jgi:hypothetical protein
VAHVVATDGGRVPDLDASNIAGPIERPGEGKQAQCDHQKAARLHMQFSRRQKIQAKMAGFE